jgi:2-dehydropantoate 2-reductase
MKVAIVGSGAVGSYYGAKLARAGHEVHFLLRSDFDHVKRFGVKILSPEGDFVVRPRPARTADEIGPCDLVVVALKTTANSEFPKLLPPLVGSSTAILTLQNGLGNEEALARIFPVEQILGGLCFVCLNRVSPGVINHIAHGKIEMGEFQRWPEPRTHDIASAFRHAGVPCNVRDNLQQAHWEKLVWNIPFNGLCVASCAGFESFTAGEAIRRSQDCLTTDQLLADPRWSALVFDLMLEVVAAANAFGFTIPTEFAREQIHRTSVMGAYKPSTMIDFMNKKAIELETLFAEPLRRAVSKSVLTAILRRLGEVLLVLQQENELENP